MRPMTIIIGISIGAALVTACGSEYDEDLAAAVDTACSTELGWGSEAHGDWSFAVLMDISGANDGEGADDNLNTELVATEASTECPENFDGYRAWHANALEELNARDGYEASVPEQPQGSADDGLNLRGVTPAMVAAVDAIAQRTGYSYAGVDPMETALLAVIVCDQVRDGATSWSVEMREAVTDGASPSAAQLWNSFLRTDFCPYLD